VAVAGAVAIVATDAVPFRPNVEEVDAAGHEAWRPYAAGGDQAVKTFAAGGLNCVQMTRSAVWERSQAVVVSVALAAVVAALTWGMNFVSFLLSLSRPSHDDDDGEHVVVWMFVSVCVGWLFAHACRPHRHAHSPHPHPRHRPLFSYHLVSSSSHHYHHPPLFRLAAHPQTAEHHEATRAHQHASEALDMFSL
jgi:hypothetical protein